MTADAQAKWLARALQPPADPSWRLQDGADHDHMPGPAARFAVSNGALGLTGYLEQPADSSWPHTFVAGLFDAPAGAVVPPALVAGPRWWLRVWVDQPLPTAGERGRVLDYRRGVLLTEWCGPTAAGTAVRLRTLQFPSLADRALALEVTEVWAEAPTAVELEATLEVPDAALEPLPATHAGLVFAGTTRAGHSLAVASTTGLQVGPEWEPVAGQVEDGARRWSCVVGPDQPAVFSRIVAVVRGDAELDPRPVAARALRHARRRGVRRLVADQARAWAERWDASDVVVQGDPAAQAALRFAVYQLVGAANPDDDQVSIGARGLTGVAYSGHVFWDTETFLLPFYTFTWPEAARALLLYRYHTLPAARAKASRLGYRGALYAWESTDSGDETTPTSAVGPDGKVVAIRCGTDEQHVSADIAYAVWQYWQATGDDTFLLEAGAEIILETARFWASRARLEPDGRYHIRGVIGPDEYHEDIDDNAFTNAMARWNLQRGLELVQLLRGRWPERWAFAAAALGLDDAELAAWRQVADGLVTGFDPATGLIEQFAGYFRLESIDLAAYSARTVPMDVVLGRERTQQSQVIKQADVVMLLALLGHDYSAEVRAKNFRYYEPRSGHGSSLSPAMHALVAAQVGEVELAWRYLAQAAEIDLGDSMGNAANGVHLANQGGIWQAAVLGFAGLRLRDDGLSLEPHLPSAWGRLGFAAQWRGRRVRFALDRERRLVTATLERGDPLVVAVGGEERTVGPDAAATWQRDL
jgi:trehalose/maltose hydrolase-like predicted phosphorylase